MKRAEIEKLMDAEAFMGSSEAVKNGFADAVDDRIEAPEGDTKNMDRGFMARRQTEAALAKASAADMFETIEAGHILLADRAYDSDALRTMMTERGAWANIRAMPNRVKTFSFSSWVYRQRNAVERFFNKLKHFRAVATRYDKRDDNFLASVQLASIRIWLRTYESVT